MACSAALGCSVLRGTYVSEPGRLGSKMQTTTCPLLTFQISLYTFSFFFFFSSGEGNGNPLPYSCLENPMDKRGLVGYSSWGCKELDITERLHFHFFTFLFFNVIFPFGIKVMNPSSQTNVFHMQVSTQLLKHPMMLAETLQHLKIKPSLTPNPN